MKDRCPKGIYLVPVPQVLYNTPDTSNEELEQSPSTIYLKDITPYTKVPPWQGVIFIRNPESPYSGGVFRFDITFLKHNQIRQWLQQTSGTANIKAISTPYSYNYYPIIQLKSEIHHMSNEQDRIAEYCLNGIWIREQDYFDQQKPFSRVLYALERLVDWFNGTNVNHQPHLANVDTQLSKSDTLLYHTLKNSDEDHSKSESSVPRLINFVQDEQPLRHDVLCLLSTKNHDFNNS